MSQEESVEVGSIQIAPNFSLDVQDHLIDRGVAVMGIRRSGKSYTIGVICEQLLDLGQPIIVVDLMGEYYTLRERFDILIAALGDVPYADIKYLSPEMAGQLAEFVVSSGLSVIIDLKHGRMISRFEFLAAFLKELYHVEERLKRPYVLIMDEGHRIVPEKGVIRIQSIRKVQTEVEAWVYEIGATGGHYGLGFIVAARRSAEISKMILSQVEVRIFHKLADPTDLNYIREWLDREEAEKVRRFSRGEAVVVGLEEPLLIKVDERICSHGGKTPLAKPVETPELHDAIVRLSELLTRPEEEAPPEVEFERLQDLEAEKERLEGKVRNLDSALAEEHARASGLEASVNVWKKRVGDLEARLPEAERMEAVMREYEGKVDRLQSEVQEKSKEIEDLGSQLDDASENLLEVEEIQELLRDWRDIMVELAMKFGVEIVPGDMQKIIDERDYFQKKFEELQDEVDRRAKLAKEILDDARVKHWISSAKRVLDGYLGRRSYQGRVLVKLISTDPSYKALPEEFPEAQVAASTVAGYLNEFVTVGLAFKHERAKQGRTAFSNRFPLWISENVRRIRVNAPDVACKRIEDQLREHALKRV